MFYSGYVAIIGKPNVGKSTLLNNLLGVKLSAVTPKPQTTRHRILGILSGENYQIIFLDTPGIFEPKYKLQEVMVKTAFLSIQEAEVVFLMVEATDSLQETKEITKKLSKKEKPVFLLINKIDLVEKEKLLPLIDEYQKLFPFAEIIPISALKNFGLDDLLKTLLKYLPEGSPYYPSEMLTNQPERFFVTELVRQKIFEHYGEEVPYSTTVLIEEFRERAKNKNFIRAIIYVEKESQKGIIIGAKGQKLKEIGELARKEIEEFLGRGVFLELWVKVREKWRKNIKDLKEFGYL
ncbi:MAG: GTPase Era [Candidatus Edwardsbacteria bacterium]